MLPFALQAVSACPAHADLALALGAEFEPVSVDDAEAELEALAATLAPLRHADPRAQLAGCAAAVAASWSGAGEPQRIARDCVLDDLLLHRVLARSSGHPLTLTVAAVEAARRAGIQLGVVGGRGEHYLAHVALADPHVADLGAGGAIVDLGGREQTVAWRCAHQVAALLIDRIAARAERVGHVTWALRAATLRLALPVTADAREQMERDLERVRAYLN